MLCCVVLYCIVECCDGTGNRVIHVSRNGITLFHFESMTGFIILLIIFFLMFVSVFIFIVSIFSYFFGDNVLAEVFI